jgi:hypothetical protein
MLGPETIRNISDVAAYRAAEEGKKPLAIWRGNEEQDVRGIPFLGDYCPVGYRPATFLDVRTETALPFTQAQALLARYGYRSAGDVVDLLVDASGWGSEDEPALTFAGFAAIAGGGYWAIVEEGQFQIVARLYVKDASAPGTPGPDIEDVECTECHQVHNDLEECDEESLEAWAESETAYEYCHGCDAGIDEGDANVIEAFAENVMYRDEDESGILCDKCYGEYGPSIDKAYVDDRDPIERYGTPEHEAWLVEQEQLGLL